MSIIEFNDISNHNITVSFTAGCDIPFNVDYQLLNKSALISPNKAGSGKAAYPTGTHVNIHIVYVLIVSIFNDNVTQDALHIFIWKIFLERFTTKNSSES